MGVHGIILAFECPAGSGRRYSATYLPEVAREQRESLQSLQSLAMCISDPSLALLACLFVCFLKSSTHHAPAGWSRQEALESLVRKAGYNVSPFRLSSCHALD